MSLKNLNILLTKGKKADIIAYSLMSAIAKDWNKGTLKVEYAKNRQRTFQAGLPLQENKRNKNDENHKRKTSSNNQGRS